MSHPDQTVTRVHEDGLSVKAIQAYVRLLRGELSGLIDIVNKYLEDPTPASRWLLEQYLQGGWDALQRETGQDMVGDIEAEAAVANFVNGRVQKGFTPEDIEELKRLCHQMEHWREAR